MTKINIPDYWSMLRSGKDALAERVIKTYFADAVINEAFKRFTMPDIGSPLGAMSITGRRRLVKPQDGYPDPELYRAYASLVSKSLDDELSRLFFPEWSGMFTTTCTSPSTEEMTFDIEAMRGLWSDAARKVGMHPLLGAPYVRPTGPSPTFRHAYGPSNFNWMRCPGHLTMLQARSPGKSTPLYHAAGNFADFSGLESRIASAAQMAGEYDLTRYQEKMLRHVAESTRGTYQQFASDINKMYGLRPFSIGWHWQYAEEVWYHRLKKGGKGYTLPRGLKRRLKRIYANKVWDMLPSGVRVFRDKRNVENKQAQFYATVADQMRLTQHFNIVHDEIQRFI